MLARTTTISPAYYGAGRRIELDVGTVGRARTDFHSLDTNTSVDYDARIACTGGIANKLAGDALAYNAASHMYLDSTPYVDIVALSTVTDVTNARANYATLASPALTANCTVGSLSIF